MRFDKFTLKVQEAIQEAQTLAGHYGHQGIDVEHLLFAFLEQPEGMGHVFQCPESYNYPRLYHCRQP